MRGLMMVISNSEEIAKAIELKKTDDNVIVPEKEMDYTDFLFDANKVSLSYIGSDDSIRIIYEGQDLSLKYDEKLFKALEDNFNKRK